MTTASSAFGPFALALLLPVHASAEFSCPVFEPAAVSEADARYASKPMVDCAVKFIGGKASGTPHARRTPHARLTPHISRLTPHARRTPHAARTPHASRLTPHAARTPHTAHRTPRA